MSQRGLAAGQSLLGGGQVGVQGSLRRQHRLLGCGHRGGQRLIDAGARDPAPDRLAAGLARWRAEPVLGRGEPRSRRAGSAHRVGLGPESGRSTASVLADSCLPCVCGLAGFVGGQRLLVGGQVRVGRGQLLVQRGRREAASTWPATTRVPTPTGTQATVPATGKETVTRFTADTVPTSVSVWSTEPMLAVASR